MTRNSPASPVLRSHLQFSWEKIISGNPERQMKKHATLNRKLSAPIPAKSEPVLLIQRQSNRVKQKLTASLPEMPEPTNPGKQTADTSSFSNPTPAMLEIISKMRQKASTPAIAGGKKVKSERWGQSKETCCLVFIGVRSHISWVDCLTSVNHFKCRSTPLKRAIATFTVIKHLHCPSWPPYLQILLAFL